MINKLYILMRSDLESMNAGKAIAQGAHAAHVFARTMNLQKQAMTELQASDPANIMARALDNFREWETQAEQGYGTVITLDAGTGGNMEYLCRSAEKHDIVAGIVTDPTYPIKDGKVTHLIPLNTCGWIFVGNYINTANWSTSALLNTVRRLELLQ